MPISLRSRGQTIVLCVAALALVSLAACSRNSTPLEAAASVNGKVISKAAVALSAASDDPALQQAALDALISEQLFADAAQNLKLDQNPQVAAGIENAQRKVLARAFVEHQTSQQDPISEAELSSFYAEHPELFSDRKVYRVQELSIEVPPGSGSRITQAFQDMRTLGDRAAWLKQNGVPYQTQVVVRPAEDWSRELLTKLMALPIGGAIDIANPRGFSILQVTGIERQPMSFDQAKGRITKFLTNQRAAALIKTQSDLLRAKAKVERFDPFAAPASASASTR